MVLHRDARDLRAVVGHDCPLEVKRRGELACLCPQVSAYCVERGGCDLSAAREFSCDLLRVHSIGIPREGHDDHHQQRAHECEDDKGRPDDRAVPQSSARAPEWPGEVDVLHGEVGAKRGRVITIGRFGGVAAPPEGGGNQHPIVWRVAVIDAVTWLYCPTESWAWAEASKTSKPEQAPTASPMNQLIPAVIRSLRRLL